MRAVSLDYSGIRSERENQSNTAAAGLGIPTQVLSRCWSSTVRAVMNNTRACSTDGESLEPVCVPCKIYPLGTKSSPDWLKLFGGPSVAIEAWRSSGT